MYNLMYINLYLLTKVLDKHIASFLFYTHILIILYQWGKIPKKEELG